MNSEAELQKKNTSHGIEVLPQDTTHLIQRPCYQRGSPCQDPRGNRTTRCPPDHRKETQTAVVWSCLPFIRSGQNHFARHSERGKKTRQTEKEVGRQHQGMDRPGEGLDEECFVLFSNWQKIIISNLCLNCEGRWGTTDDSTTSFLYFSLFSTALWDLANSKACPFPDVCLPTSSSVCLSLSPPPQSLCLARYE